MVGDKIKEIIDFVKIKKVEEKIKVLLDKFEFEEITENELSKGTRHILSEMNVTHEEIQLMLPLLQRRADAIEKILKKDK